MSTTDNDPAASTSATDGNPTLTSPDEATTPADRVQSNSSQGSRRAPRLGPGIGLNYSAVTSALGVLRGMDKLVDVRGILRTLDDIQELPPLRVNTLETMTAVAAEISRSAERVLPFVSVLNAGTTSVPSSGHLMKLVGSIRPPRMDLSTIFRQVWLWDSFKIPPAHWQELVKTVAGLRLHLFPPNLAPIEDLKLEDLSKLAGEGITVWSVPRTKIAIDLLHAPTRQARRAILGQRWMTILADCAAAAEKQVGGIYGDQARLVQLAIAAARGGHVEAAQALASNALETVLQMAYPKPTRVELTSHKNGRPDALDDLRVAESLVMEAIWVAYRPYHTPAERAALVGFSRHATTHVAGRPQLNRRNMVQVVMLASALITVKSEG